MGVMNNLKRIKALEAGGSASVKSTTVPNGITDVTINSVNKTSAFNQLPFLIGDGHIMCFTGIGLSSNSGVKVTDSYLQFVMHTDVSFKTKFIHDIAGLIKYSEKGAEKSMYVSFQHSGNEIRLRETIELANEITLKEIIFDSSPWFLT